MMQSRRWAEHGSSGELDVFGATSYFAGCHLPPAPDDDCRRHSSASTEPSSADRLYFQQAAAKVQCDTTRMTTTVDNSFRSPQQQLQQQLGLHDHAHAERHVTNKQLQVVAAKRQPSASGKSKLAALLSFMVSPSPSPRTSFRKEKKQEAPSTARLRQAEAAAPPPAAAAGGERSEPAHHTYYKPNSPASSSRESCSTQLQVQGLLGAHDDDDDDDEELDLGVATGDRRLQGITIVRSRGGDEKRWVVRCVPGGACCWDDEERRREKVLDDAEESAASSEQQNIKEDDELVEVEQLQGDDDDDYDHGNTDPAAAHSWDSDSSSDLFDLDLEYR